MTKIVFSGRTPQDFEVAFVEPLDTFAKLPRIFRVLNPGVRKIYISAYRVHGKESERERERTMDRERESDG